MDNIETMFQAYVASALWSTNDESDPYGGEPLDKNYSIDDIEEKTLAKMRADCEKFLNDNKDDIDDACSNLFWHRDYGNVGHDFWLTRNHHGCGFWDGDWPEPQAKRLTDSAHAFGEFDLYVGDDGRIYS